jgi:hypothetical protein
MLRVTAFASVLACLALGHAVAQTSAGSRVPDGTYLTTCKNVRFSDNVLEAACMTERGHSVVSRLLLSNCARGSDIANRNGFLYCWAGAHPEGGAIPRGTYATSCDEIRVDGNTLRAQCKSRTGRVVSATLDLKLCPTGAEIINNDGQLLCPR